MSADAGFDARLRELHAQSLAQLSPRVQAQLAQRRRAALQGAPIRHRRGLLPWAGVATAGLALALVLQLRPPTSRQADAGIAMSAARPAATTTRTPAAVDTRMAVRGDADAIAPDLSEDPEFYLWLGDVRPADAE